MARLAEISRPSESAIYEPTIRPRVLRHIEAAAHHPIILMVAPAGYGKSVALTHWIQTLRTEHVRFNVQAEHDTLLGFARGLAEALGARLPALRTTVAGAHQNASCSTTPGAEMANWMASHLESFNGFIAIDDFHRANDPEISRFISVLISRTKAHMRWLVSTRSTLDLPVASWLAYGDAAAIIGEDELAFDAGEARELCSVSGSEIREDFLSGIIDATAGWPVALGLALRNPGIAQQTASLALSTRELLFRYLAEQVYAGLSPAERLLLHFASYLPSVEIRILEMAGFTDAAPSLESVRSRAAFLSLEAGGVYKIHDLFREFLCQHIERTNPEQSRNFRSDAALALVQSDDIAAGLRLFSGLGATEKILDLLRAYGFELIDRSHGDAVVSAVSALPAAVRLANPVILGLRAQLETDRGHFDRAEALFKKAIDSSGTGFLRSTLSIRLAILLRNQGRRVNNLLEPLGGETSPPELAGEIYGLLAADYGLAGDQAKAQHCITIAQECCAAIESDETRAKVLLRIGIAAMAIDLPESEILSVVSQAIQLAEENGMLGLAARARTVAALTKLFYHYDVSGMLADAQTASELALRAGDRFSLQVALAYELIARVHQGDPAALESVLLRMQDATTTDSSRQEIIRLDAKASLLIWNGLIEQAAELMSGLCIYFGYYDFDKAVAVATHALLMAVLHRSGSANLVREAMVHARACTARHRYGSAKRYTAILICAAAESLSGRTSHAEELLRFADTAAVSGLKALRDTVSALNSPSSEWPQGFEAGLLGLNETGHVGLALIIRSAVDRWREHQPQVCTRALLTTAERSILQSVAAGLSTKEIAWQTNRSIYTVRTLLQRSMSKLGCSSRTDAVNEARRQGLLTIDPNL